MSQLQLDRISVDYADVSALRGVDLAIEPGEFFTIVGPTNAGKSTLLKSIAGLVRPGSGAVMLKGRDVTGISPRDRNVSLLFQNIALFPNQSGYDNIAFPLKVAGVSESDIRKRVDELAGILKVSHVLDRMPRTFSGGEQQRVAIGRAIAAPADLLMLDEPLTNLDARIRIALRVEFKKIHRSLEQTLVYVTHDQIEAMSLSDRIAVLNDGQLEQVGTPDEIYHRPRTRFVAEFFGSPPMNILPGCIIEESGVKYFEIGGNRIPLPAEVDVGVIDGQRDSLAIGIRSENVRISTAESDSTPVGLPVRWSEHYGSHSVIELDFAGNAIRVRTPPDSPVDELSHAFIGFDINRHSLLDTRTDRFLT